MNDKDREAFDKWFADKDWNKYECQASWQAALDYARKEQRELLERYEESLSMVGRVINNEDKILLGSAYDEMIKQYLAVLHAAGIGSKS